MNASEQARQDLADNLRVLVAGGVLDQAQARAVYASMYGVRETDLEFGMDEGAIPSAV